MLGSLKLLRNVCLPVAMAATAGCNNTSIFQTYHKLDYLWRREALAGTYVLPVNYHAISTCHLLRGQLMFIYYIVSTGLNSCWRFWSCLSSLKQTHPCCAAQGLQSDCLHRLQKERSEESTLCKGRQFENYAANKF